MHEKDQCVCMCAEFYNVTICKLMCKKSVRVPICLLISPSLSLPLLLTRNRCPGDLPPLTRAPLEYNSALLHTLPAQPPDSRPGPHHPSAQTWDFQSRLRDCDGRATSQDRLLLHLTPAGGGRVQAGLCPSLCCKWSLKSRLTALSSMSSSGGVLFTALATLLNTTRFSLMVSAG